jgi:short-subunit dehydrogenase
LRSGYCGAKHALHGFFESLRAEHHQDNLDVTMVCPGFIQTSISLNAMVGDGSQQGTMDAKTGGGITAEVCAQRMIRAVERKKAQVLIGRSEILAAYIARFFPRLLRLIIRKAAVR